MVCNEICIQRAVKKNGFVMKIKFRGEKARFCNENKFKDEKPLVLKWKLHSDVKNHWFCNANSIQRWKTVGLVMKIICWCEKPKTRCVSCWHIWMGTLAWKQKKRENYSSLTFWRILKPRKPRIPETRTKKKLKLFTKPNVFPADTHGMDKKKKSLFFFL